MISCCCCTLSPEGDPLVQDKENKNKQLTLQTFSLYLSLSRFSIVPPKQLLMYRLTPADHRQLFPSSTTMTTSTTLSSSFAKSYDQHSNTAAAAAWQVSQLLSSIRSINSSLLSYLPLVNFSTTPSSSSSSSSSFSSTSIRSHLHMTELSSSVLYLDEGVDTLIGCEAIGGRWKPLFFFTHLFLHLLHLFTSDYAVITYTNEGNMCAVIYLSLQIVPYFFHLCDKK